MALITANNTNERTILILLWVGYLLKFVPFFPISVTGWCLDIALDVLQFQKYDDRATIFQFLLDKANYPDDASYYVKVDEYVRDLEPIRGSDMLSGSAYYISLVSFPGVLWMVFNPLTWIWQSVYMLLIMP